MQQQGSRRSWPCGGHRRFIRRFHPGTSFLHGGRDGEDSLQHSEPGRGEPPPAVTSYESLTITAASRGFCMGSAGQLAGKIGFRSGILTFGFAADYSIAQIAALFGVFAPPWDWVFLFTPSLFLASAFLVLMVAVLGFAAEEHRIWGCLAVAFAILYAALVSMVYFVELVVVVPLVLQGRGGLPAAVRARLFHGRHGCPRVCLHERIDARCRTRIRGRRIAALDPTGPHRERAPGVPVSHPPSHRHPLDRHASAVRPPPDDGLQYGPGRVNSIPQSAGMIHVGDAGNPISPLPLPAL